MAAYYKHGGKGSNARKKPHGCLRALGIGTLWFLGVCILFSQAIPKDKQTGTFFFVSLMLVLFLPIYIKPLFRLSISLIKHIRAKRELEKIVGTIVVSDDRHKENQIDGVDRTVHAEVPNRIGQMLNETVTKNMPSTFAAPQDSKDCSAPAIDPYASLLDSQEDKVQAELLSIDLMEGHKFEEWCADALKSKGFANVSVTPGSGDQGVDVLAEKDGVKYAFQCKRYNSDLGNTPVQEVHSGKDYYHRHVGVVITNHGFTHGAVSLAKETGTLLWGREWIISYLNEKYSADHPLTTAFPQPQSSADDIDEMFDEAVEIILETGIASVSVLQRRLKLGYARAARLVDKMEDAGIVGPYRGSQPREIMITQEDWKTWRTPLGK